MPSLLPVAPFVATRPALAVFALIAPAAPFRATADAAAVNVPHYREPDSDLALCKHGYIHLLQKQQNRIV